MTLKGYRYKQSRNYVAIRACAAIILEAMTSGVELNVKQFNSAIVREAYTLLMFEGIISRKTDYALTENGKKHIAKNGFQVYKPIENGDV